ncbi:YHS domain-containing protein [Chitinophaga solisilvae]|uniref:YHS domain-containing protein n=1 Tax=Chitinophaga solisilvae TaxID=1233460 RepID=UPI00136CC822|nr:YHS domain-containing protein [Chitinophaga solisilvae]
MKYFFIASSALLIFSCNQAPKTTEKQEMPAVETTTPEQADISGKLPDPVCQMPYDTSYHEWTVYKNDTIHFCSITCKDVFAKAPEKFMAKLKK